MNLTTLLNPTLASFWMPERAATYAGEHDLLWYFLYYVSIFFFLLIIFLMVFFAIRYRRREPGQPAESQTSHSTALELTWTVPPLIIVLIVFVMGLSYVSIATPKANALRIEVQGYRWAWNFTYPNGLVVPNELHMPAGQPVELVMTSTDVIHSVWIPAFRAKKDAVPGRFNRMYLEPTRPGEYVLLCAEYCGTQHSTMIGKVVVHESYGAYQAWLEEASKAPVEDLPEELYAEWTAITSADEFDAFVEKVRQQVPEMADSLEKLEPAAITGEKLYTDVGCNQCHSLDGRSMTGPTFLGLWQKIRVFKDGSEARADENYLRDSILNPQSQIVEGYQGVMNSYQGQLSDRQIGSIIAFIRSLSAEDGQ